MQPVAVVIYGYEQAAARTIKSFLDRTLDAYVIMLSASRKEEMQVLEILRQGPQAEEYFVDEEPKLLVFVGFSEVQIHMVLEGFPAEEGVARPIFCTLTGQNKTWPFRKLRDHLLAEHRRWSGRGD